jgi:flagellar basal-body rod modification protein FlgD
MNTISQQVLNEVNARPPEEQKRNGELGQGDFLELMIAQIAHQDPFEPMENGEFIAQMAQFATVDGIQNMESSISSLNGTMSSNQAMTATALVGRSVMAPGDEFILGADGGISGSIATSEGASALNLGVYDAAGALVAQGELSPSSTGVTRFFLDGVDSTGARLAPGSYLFSAAYRQRHHRQRSQRSQTQSGQRRGTWFQQRP